MITGVSHVRICAYSDESCINRIKQQADESSMGHVGAEKTLKSAAPWQVARAWRPTQAESACVVCEVEGVVPSALDSFWLLHLRLFVCFHDFSCVQYVYTSILTVYDSIWNLKHMR